MLRHRGFLAQAYEYMRDTLPSNASASDQELLENGTFFGREKDTVVYPIALANLVLSRNQLPSDMAREYTDDSRRIRCDICGRTGAFDCILTNPPFGGKEGIEAQTNFAYRTTSTQVLFLQHC